MTTRLLAFSVFLLPVLASATPPPFRVTVEGSGAPVILIPGLASSGDVWQSTVAQLRGQYECHVLTLAGFAGEPAVPAPSLDYFRREIVSYIRARSLAKPIVIGHSLGGFLALWIAAEEPQLLGKAVAVDSLPYLPAAMNPTATPDSMRPMAESMRAATRDPKPEAAAQNEKYIRAMATHAADQDRIVSWSRRSDPPTVAQAMYDMFTIDLREKLAAIDVPVLVLGTWVAYGERPEVTERFEQQYRNLKTLTLRIAGTARHFIMYDEPEWFAQQLAGFLAQ